MTDVLDALLSDLRSRGARLKVLGDKLVVDAPSGAMTAKDLEALRATKPGILQRLAAHNEVLDMSLEEFEGADCAIEVRVPWLSETLWWVPRGEHVKRLMRENVVRGRVYTAKELTNLTMLNGGGRAGDVHRLSCLKLAFGATILSFLADSETGGAPSATVSPCRSCHGTRFWLSIHGVIVCSYCHPPDRPDLVVEWIDHGAAEGGNA